MVQNITVTPGTGATVAADLVGSALMQQVKINLGATNTDGGLVSATNGLPSNIAQVGGSALAFGQALSISSIPVTQAAPNVIPSASFTRPANTTTYATGQLVANSVTFSLVAPLSWAIAPANGVPVYIIKAKVSTSTSGGAGVTITSGIFRLHLFGTSPTIPTGTFDGATFSMPMASWYGTLDGTLEYQGTDSSVGEFYPTFTGATVVVPAGGSTTIYGYIEARGAFVSTNQETFTVTLVAQ